jgi:flagellar protein FlaI
VLRKPKKVEKVVVKPKKKPGPPTVLLPPHIKELEFKVVKEPHAYVRIVYDHQLHEHRYIVMEPDLSDSERKLYDMLKDIFARTLAYTFEKEDGIKAEDYLRKTVDNLLTSHMIEIEHEVKEKILYYVIRDFIGYGKIDVLMRDEAIEDISCDGPKVPIFLYHRVYESIETNIVFDTEDELDSFVIKLAQRCGKLITALNPMVDATMPDGSRLQATLAREVTTGGSSFTIRKFRADPLTPPDLVDLNTMSPEMVAYLWLAIQHGKSILFCGGTASGKTTTLNAMSIFIPSKAKIVSIEDTREINLPHKNWIASVTRGSFGGVEKKDKTETEIDMFDLMKAALRQRPQYIIVGEVRGREAFTMFQAMATGHATFSTLHADSIQSMIYRLEHPPINLPRVLMGSLNIIVIQLLTKIGDKTVRRIGNIYEIVGLAPENMELLVNEVYRWVPETDRFIYTGKSVILEEIKQTSNIDDEELWENIRQRIDIITWLRKKRKRHVSEVGEIVSGYYKEPANIIEKVRGDLYGS